MTTEQLEQLEHSLGTATDYDMKVVGGGQEFKRKFRRRYDEFMKRRGLPKDRSFREVIGSEVRKAKALRKLKRERNRKYFYEGEV